MGIFEVITVIFAAASNDVAPHPSLLATIAVIVGVVSGVVGVTLGIVNCVDQRRTKRPHLVVRPSVSDLVHPSGQVEKGVAMMEISNVGQIPVVGSSIGFEPRWQWVYRIIRFLPQRMRASVGRFIGERQQSLGQFIPMPIPMNGVTWTGHQLGPQQCSMLRFDLDGLPEARKLGRAYATTAVGDKFKANRRDMRVFARLREAVRLNAEASP